MRQTRYCGEFKDITLCLAATPVAAAIMCLPAWLPRQNSSAQYTNDIIALISASVHACACECVCMLAYFVHPSHARIEPDTTSNERPVGPTTTSTTTLSALAHSRGCRIPSRSSHRSRCDDDDDGWRSTCELVGMENHTRTLAPLCPNERSHAREHSQSERVRVQCTKINGSSITSAHISAPMRKYLFACTS